MNARSATPKHPIPKGIDIVGRDSQPRTAYGAILSVAYSNNLWWLATKDKLRI